MTAAATRTFTRAGTMLLLTSIAFSVLTNEPLLLLAPFCLLAAFVLLHHPLFLFYVLLASIPWSFEYNFSGSLGTDLPDEPLMILTAFAALLIWIRTAKQPPRFHPLLFVVLATFGWMWVTVTVSSFPVYSLKYAAAKTWYLLAFVALPVLLNPDKVFLQRSAVVLAVSMFAVMLVALYKHAGLGFTFANVNEALQPFFHNHVNYAALLVLIVPLQVAFLRHAKNGRQRFALWVSLLIVTAALYFSYSRGAWLAFVVGLAGFWLIKKGWLFKSFLSVGLLATISFIWLGYGNNFLRFAPDHNATIFHQDFSEHLAATYAGKDVSTAERFYRWTAAPGLIADHPLAGVGPTTFYHNYKPYAVPLFRTWVSDNNEKSTVHNYFLLLAIEQGIPGLLLFLLLVGLMIWYAQRLYRQTDDRFWKTVVAATGSILLMQCTLNFLSDLIETDKFGSVFYLCLATIVIAERRMQDTKRRMNL